MKMNKKILLNTLLGISFIGTGACDQDICVPSDSDDMKEGHSQVCDSSFDRNGLDGRSCYFEDCKPAEGTCAEGFKKTKALIIR